MTIPAKTELTVDVSGLRLTLVVQADLAQLARERGLVLGEHAPSELGQRATGLLAREAAARLHQAHEQVAGVLLFLLHEAAGSSSGASFTEALNERLGIDALGDARLIGGI